MRWDALFSDLEDQLVASAQLDLEAEISERARIEASARELVDRLRAHVGYELGLWLKNGTKLAGRLSHIGRDWLVLDSGAHEYLVAYPAVLHYRGLGRRNIAETSTSWARISLASALRTIARDRSEVQIQLLDAGENPLLLRGVLDRVGIDHMDVAVLTSGQVRRSGTVENVLTIPFGSLAVVQSLRQL